MDTQLSQKVLDNASIDVPYVKCFHEARRDEAAGLEEAHLWHCIRLRPRRALLYAAMKERARPNQSDPRNLDRRACRLTRSNLQATTYPRSHRHENGTKHTNSFGSRWVTVEQLGRSLTAWAGYDIQNAVHIGRMSLMFQDQVTDRFVTNYQVHDPCQRVDGHQ